MSCVARGRLCVCEGRIQSHHAIPQQRIKRLHRDLTAAYRRGRGAEPPPLSRLLSDRCDLVDICKRHHELVEQHVIYLAAEDLPQGVWGFAAELDRLAGIDGADPFTAQLEAEYPRMEAA